MEERLSLLAPLGLVVACVLAAAVATGKRPRFVTALAAAAVSTAVLEELALVSGPLADYRRGFLGMELAGAAGAAAAVVHAAAYLVCAVGLWRLAPWGRAASMVVLVYLLASFLLWGVGERESAGALYVLAWQMIVLPFLTFSLMYLHNGARYFGVRPSERESKTGWLY